MPARFVPEGVLNEELVPRQCRLEPYEPREIPTFTVARTFIAYCSPDSTWVVTRELLSAARESILIGIYDFEADYVRDLLKDARGRGVAVSLMLDCDCLKGEPEVFDELVAQGCECVPAPSCASLTSHFFSCCHEKVIVVDGHWTLVQSGNWTHRSLPRNETDGAPTPNFVCGNRDMGLAVDSADLAAFFADVLRGDIRLELEHGGGARRPCRSPESGTLYVESPTPPPMLFPSRRFQPGEPLVVQPVLSPDNYMLVVPQFLANARESIRVEQQYIKAGQPEVRRLLEAIDAARNRNPELQIRIVLARGFALDDLREQIDALEARGLRLGEHIRILNPRHFTHCHNKFIAVDDERVLVSSQNWSDTAVTKNREAGLIVHSPEITRYFAQVFDADWDDGEQTLPSPRVGALAVNAEGLPTFTPISRSDLVEV